MPARADVEMHLGRRGALIDQALRDWSEPALTAADRTELTESYFAHANLGDSGRVGGGQSVAAERCRAPRGAPTILVIGTHDVSDLAQTESNPARRFDPSELRGPGIGSTFAPMVAFVEGFKAALTTGRDEPINIRFLSLGPDENLLRGLAEIKTDDIDAIFFTNSMAWYPTHPTITTGARGRLEVSITVTAGQLVNDAVFAGAVRNPLNKLVELVGRLRDDKGKIALPGFYGRALPPTTAERSAITDAGFDPDAWIEGLNVRRPAGTLSALERATLWPVISISDVTSPNTTRSSTPASATATLSIYLIPDQRPVEVETGLRRWIEDRMPSNLAVAVRVVSTARPYRSSPQDQAVAAQARAISRVHGRPAAPIPGGGAIGAGEVHFATGVPIGFAGISGPQQGFGSADEVVPRALFDLGLNQAAETCLQLPRRTALRSTS